jgi:uncharacterized membrane protein YjfL (UPF0719 family)
MNLFPFLQAGVAFATGIGSMAILYALVERYLSKVQGITENNTAAATFKAGIFIGNALLISAITGPGLNAIRFMNQGVVNAASLLNSAGFILLFMLIALVFSILVIAGGVLILFQLTKINEWEEIRNNQIPTALVSAALIVGLSLIMKDQVALLCEMLIPYPEVLPIR